MYKNKRIVAVIPARGGSKSVPHKNIHPLGGRPLIAWSIGVALATEEIDRIIVSTDDEKIAAVAREYRAEVYARPTHLAADESLVIDALRDLARTFAAEGETAPIMVLLEPTCPLRAVDDVRSCIHLLVDKGYDSAATFKEADLNPHRAWKIVNDKPEVFIPGAVPWLPRQKLPSAYQLNGAVYAFHVRNLDQEGVSILTGALGAVVMPRERSVDIDNAIDFDIVESIMEKGGK